MKITEFMRNSFNGTRDLQPENSMPQQADARGGGGGECTGIGTVLRKMFRLGSIVMNKIHWRLRKKTEIVKHLSQNFYIKILSLWPSGLGKVRYKILDQFLSPCQTWINPSKASQKQTL